MRVNIATGARLLGAALLVAAARAEAQPWSLTQCDSAGAPGWREFESQMHAAKVGSTLYVPIPFPVTPEQVVQDYVYQYRSVINGINPKARQPSEARVLDDLASGKITYQVLRIENWTVSRCHKQQKRDFYQLVRVFEPGGTEVTRAVINDSGLLTTWNNLPASAPGPVPALSRTLPPASAAMAELNGQLGIQGENPEYIAAGGSLNCLLTHPCLAFRKAELAYISTGGQLYEVSASGPQLTLGKDVGAPAEESLLRGLGPTERLVSLGGKRFTIARQVDPSMVRKGVSAFTP